MSRVRSLAVVLALLFIFMIPWEGVLTLAGGTTGVALLGFVLAAVWLTLVVMRRRLRPPHPFFVAFYLFVLWSAMSTFWSEGVGTTVSQAITWAQLFAFTYIFWDLFQTREWVSAALQAYVLGAYLAIAIAVYNFASGSAFYDFYQRFAPTGVNPDGFGFAIALAIPIAFYLGGENVASYGSRFFALANYAYIPAAFLGLALSGTRAALIAAIPGLIYGLLSLTRFQMRTRVATVLLLVLAVGALLPFVQPLRSFQRFGTTVTEITEGDLNNRVPNWVEGIDSVLERPVLGIGSGTYALLNSRGNVAHNSFLSVAVEVGLIGFALFVLIIAIAATEVLRLPRAEWRFWFTLMFVWAIGASALTWEDRRSTWLVLTSVVIMANLTNPRYGYRAPRRPEQRGELVRVGEPLEP